VSALVRGSLPRQPRAVVFDMDGVLVDSEPLWHEAEIEVFGRHGIALTSADCAETTGVRIDAVVEHWRGRFPAAFQGVKSAAVVDAIVAGVVERVSLRGQAMRGVDEAIAAVASHGMPLAVASSSPPAIINAVLQRLGVRHHFAAVLSAWGLPRGKPDPEVYFAACAALGHDPGDVVAIEDSQSGLLAGLAAGMMVIGVPDPRVPPPAALSQVSVVLLDLYGLAGVLRSAATP
jgi:HAD superfamily hydrolase (TIGR01509 family)